MGPSSEVVGAASLSVAISAVAVAIAGLVGVPAAAFLGLSTSRAAGPVRIAARVVMSFPTVLVGLLVYGLLTRHGPLGGLGLLFTPQAIVAGEILLALPLVVALGDGAVASLDPRFRDTAAALRLSRVRTAWLAVSEAREGFVLALLTAFARCVTELGVALLVGGNFPGQTRTLTTAIALETSRGDFDRAARLGWVLVVVALAVNLALALFRGRPARS